LKTPWALLPKELLGCIDVNVDVEQDEVVESGDVPR
jgi:hypothetical protein